MPSAKELAKALARQDSVTQQPRDRFLGATSDAFKFLSDQADRYVVPERDPLLAGMRGGDLLPFGNVARLLDDLSHGGRITTGRGQTTALRPEVVDAVALGGMLKNPLKLAGIAALKNAAKQIHTGTGVLGSKVMNPRMNMFAGEGAKTADHGALKVAKDMKAAGVPDEQIHAKTGWFAGMADGKWRFEIDDSAAKGQFTHLSPSLDRLAEKAIIHPSIYKAYPDLSEISQLGLKEARESGSNISYSTNGKPSSKGTIIAEAPDEAGIKSVGLHELQHAIQRREGFARGGTPEEFITSTVNGTTLTPEAQEMFNSALIKNHPKMSAEEIAFRQRDAAQKVYESLAGESEARLTAMRMDMTAPERAASYPPSMFDLYVPVKDQIVRYGDNVGGAMMQRPKTEFEILHDTAQRNAALPKEQGGLGLPEGNTGMDRAGAMGFDTPAYHGTNRALTEFSLTKAGDKTGNPNSSLGVFSTPNTDEASRYASNWGTDGGNVIPLLVRGGNTYQMPYKELDDHAMLPYRLLQQDPSYDANSVIKFGDMAGQREAASRLSKAEELAQIEVQKRRSFLQSEGYDSAIVSPGKKMEERIVFDPANIRSRFAAFDPFRRHEADLLAGVGVGGMLDPQAIAEALRQQDRK